MNKNDNFNQIHMTNETTIKKTMKKLKLKKVSHTNGTPYDRKI
jgi:hypothetical protein